MNGARRGWIDAWNRFWFAEAHTHSLGLLRIFLGITLLMRQTRMYGLHRIDRFRAYIPRYEYDESAMPDPDFAMPWPLLEWVPAPSLWVYHRLDELVLVLAALFTVGLFTRIVTPLLAIIFIYTLAASQVNYYHHFWLFTAAFTVLAFSHCGERFSLDAYLRASETPPPKRSRLPLRLLQTLISMVYFFSCLAKLNSGWFSGDIMRIFDESGSIRGPFAPLFLKVLGYQGLSLPTLLAEGFLAVALWHPRLRRTAIAVGVMLHLGIDMLMAVRTFSFQMLAMYIVFIDPGAGRTIALIDGHCRLCRRSSRIGRLLDWLRRISWLDFRDEQVRALVPSLALPELERQMTVITADGRVHRGFHAWREIVARFPLTFIPSVLLWVPGAGRIGQRLYGVAARHRFGRSACRPGDTCVSPPDATDPRAPWRETLVTFGEMGP